MKTAPRLILLALAMSPLSALATSPTYAALGEARDVICEFQKTSVAPHSNTDMLLVVEGIDAEAQRAHIVSSRSVGAKPVHIYPGEEGVHFVEDASGSAIVTTILACDAWDTKVDGRRTCRHFPAVNAWHLDASVYSNPDLAYRRLPGAFYSGSCEPWNVD